MRIAAQVIVVSMIALAVVACILAQGATPRAITAKDARDLVYAMLKADDWTKLSGFGFDTPYISPDFPGFYQIHAIYDNPGGSNTVGHYAVEQTTGEVWDWVICTRFATPALLKAQQTLRKRMNLTDAEYKKLRKPGPFCEPGESPHVRNDLGRPRADALGKSNRK
jgi:hypothetical protein